MRSKNKEDFYVIVRNIIVGLQATQDEKIKRIADMISFRLRLKDINEDILRTRILNLECEIERLKKQENNG